MAHSSMPPVKGVRLDSKALRVLAHPLRSRLLTELRLHGPATATTLAAALDTNSGATSYHLRKLAEVGLVEEAEQSTGRERWWRAAHDMHSFSAGDYVGDPDAEAALEWLQGHYLRRFTEHLDEWAREERSWPTAWRDAAGASDYLLELTPAELKALQRDLFEVVERHRAAAAKPDTETADIDTAGSGPPGRISSGSGPREDRSGRQLVLLYLHCFPEPGRSAP